MRKKERSMSMDERYVKRSDVSDAAGNGFWGLLCLGLAGYGICLMVERNSAEVVALLGSSVEFGAFLFDMAALAALVICAIYFLCTACTAIWPDYDE